MLWRMSFHTMTRLCFQRSEAGTTSGLILQCLNTVTIARSQVKDFERELGYDLREFDLDDYRKVLRNCVVPELGLAILNAALGKAIEYPQDSLFGSW